MYYLIQYIKTGKKSKYKPLTRTTYPTETAAFNAGMQMHRAIKSNGVYAGFMVKDQNGNTLHRVHKKGA